MAGDETAVCELLKVQPNELRFPFKLDEQISCSLKLVNDTRSYVAFKVKTTSPRKYCVRPNTGVLLPRSTLEISVIMQAQHEMPSDTHLKDKFLVQAVVAPEGFTAGDINQEMFLKDSGNQIYDIKLKVLLVLPDKNDRSVGNGNLYRGDDSGKAMGALKAKIQEVNAALTTVSEERNAAIALSQRLQQELSMVTASRRKWEARNAGFSFLFVFLVGLFGVVLGFLLSS